MNYLELAIISVNWQLLEFFHILFDMMAWEIAAVIDRIENAFLKNPDGIFSCSKLVLMVSLCIERLLELQTAA